MIRYSIKEAGLTRSEEVNDDYINYWWTEESTRSLRSVYWAEIRGGKYEIGYVELDTPDGPF